MREKVFITGGAGFIGSHITESLVKKGYRVVVYDNFSSGRMENLQAVKKDVQIIKADILDGDKLTRAMKGCCLVSHQAAQLEIFRCIDDPQVDLKINTTGTLNVLEAAVKNRVRKIINASSACVYGQAVSIPQGENHPTNPNWAYGVSKLAAEKYCGIYSHNYKLPVISLRYGIVYGEREWLGRVLTMFIRRVVLENKPPVIFGQGNQLRDFIYVGDVVRLHNLCLFGRDTSEDGIFNVSTGKGTSVKQMAELVVKLSGQRLRPIFENLKEGNPSRFMPQRRRIPQELERMVLSPAKAARIFKWQARTPLEDGIKREITWIRGNPHLWQNNSRIKV
jgi:UDP-glucose 4-epimerase